MDFRNFNRRPWKPVQAALGIDPSATLYDLRRTHATFALRAGVPVFAVSRFMGTIALHYGRFAPPQGFRALAGDGRVGRWTLGGRPDRTLLP